MALGHVVENTLQEEFTGFICVIKIQNIFPIMGTLAGHYYLTTVAHFFNGPMWIFRNELEYGLSIFPLCCMYVAHPSFNTRCCCHVEQLDL